jgi:1-acyl-sn-glycerol-3-phosphate acyltransferase
LAKAIPIAPKSEGPVAYEKAIKAAAQVLAEGNLLGIFPEGSITRDGQLQEFKGGIMKILALYSAPVIPMSLNQLWGSFFSRIEKGQAMVKPFRRGFFSRVTLEVGSPIAAEQVQPESLRQVVLSLAKNNPT